MYLKQSVAFLTKLQLKQHLNIISVIIICISFVILIISPQKWQEAVFDKNSKFVWKIMLENRQSYLKILLKIIMITSRDFIHKLKILEPPSVTQGVK